MTPTRAYTSPLAPHPLRCGSTSLSATRRTTSIVTDGWAEGAQRLHATSVFKMSGLYARDVHVDHTVTYDTVLARDSVALFFSETTV